VASKSFGIQRSHSDTSETNIHQFNSNNSSTLALTHSCNNQKGVQNLQLWENHPQNLVIPAPRRNTHENFMKKHRF